MNEWMMQTAVPMNTGAWIGLAVGLVIALFGWVFTSYMLRKNRLPDERWNGILARAKAFSWNLLNPAIILGWVLVILFEGIGLSFVIMTALFVISQAAFAFSRIYLETKN